MGQSDDERENVPDDSRDDDTVSWQRLIAAQMSKYVKWASVPAVALPSDTQRGRTRTGQTDETGVSKIPGHSLPFW